MSPSWREILVKRGDYLREIPAVCKEGMRLTIFHIGLPVPDRWEWPRVKGKNRA